MTNSELQNANGSAAPSGHLKIMLGYASGVGKTFRLLDEARRRSERGQHIVIGALQPKLPPEVEPCLKTLEVIPLKQTGAGSAMDVDAILRRRPAVCIVDGLAYSNPPGLGNPKRWQDVRELIQAGIKVIASLNLQHVAELRDQVEAITGKRVLDTVPAAFLKSADEIEIIDAPPLEEPLDRSPEEQREGREREQRLSRLRELALVFAAGVVDQQLQTYLESHGVHQQFGANERILVCMTPRANLGEMIEAARIVAEKFHGELIVAYVKQTHVSSEDQAALDSRLAIAQSAGAHIEILEGDDPAETLLEYARSHGVTQIYVGHSQRKGIARWRPSPLDKLIWEGHGMDVRVFPQ